MTLHPAVAAVRLVVRRTLAPLAPGTTVVVACSGGADSLALLAAAVFEGHKMSLRVVGATVDHGLQDGSAGRAAVVVRQMAELGADETVSARVTVSSEGGPEAAAREARYAVLEQMAEHLGAATVLLGHTRDDQAETVLLGLTRGSGGRAIAGMRRSFDGFARPLLDVSRADTTAACEAEGIDVWHDPHNTDPRFTRVRVRHTVLPVLESELGPGVAVALARTADLVRPDMEYLDGLADAAYDRLRDQVPEGLPVDELAALPGPLRTRVLRLAALDAGAIGSELFHEHVRAIDALITDWRGQRWIDLPGHLRAVRRDRHLAFLTD
ncbi:MULTISPECIES: tRNA lysidine(34) synthetase TilS [unclassified Nocardioides]|uniref:tRNA lysidine(34) synthetase TilS n=1 Tax=unclassified Nocardioides TaxID=2615069 RepID=UPI0006F50CFB|nr:MULTISPECIES: tRNA lysidine(34) synthetase TilS [unclassified Nocardioides]KQY50228.1 tRNA(Ile)-lysidine synthetase [Nocardioides sp. Root140]KRF14924.1 tRNA(Ile)-lysidine synthetase [Nocardioides sp. Soil796]